MVGEGRGGEATAGAAIGAREARALDLPRPTREGSSALGRRGRTTPDHALPPAARRQHAVMQRAGAAPSPRAPALTIPTRRAQPPPRRTGLRCPTRTAAASPHAVA